MKPQVDNYFRSQSAVRAKHPFNTLQPPESPRHAVNQSMPHHNPDQGRTISYDLINSFNSLVQFDQEVENKVKDVKERYRSREKDNIDRIRTLSAQLKRHETIQREEVEAISSQKRLNLDLRRRMSELIQENQSMKQICSQFQTSLHGHQMQVNHLQNENESLLQKIDELTLKLEKRDSKWQLKIDSIDGEYQRERHKLKREIDVKDKELQQVQTELGKYKESHMGYEEQEADQYHRVRQLILDLETQSRYHINEVQKLHDYYRPYMLQCKDLQQKLLMVQSDSDQAYQSERQARKELTRMKMECEDMRNNRKYTTKRREKIGTATTKSSILGMRTSSAKHNNENIPLNNQTIQHSEYSSEYSESEADSELPDDNQVIPSLIENIQAGEALNNKYIQRMFSLQQIINSSTMHSRTKMKKQLKQQHNLFRAMAALFYISKMQASEIPCIFTAWKEYVSEKRADRIHSLVGTGELHLQGDVLKGKVLNTDLSEESSSVKESNYIHLDSSQVINEGQRENTEFESNYSNEFEEEDEDDRPEVRRENEEKERVRQLQMYEFKENDPEVLNAQLMQKYAQMQMEEGDEGEEEGVEEYYEEYGEEEQL